MSLVVDRARSLIGVPFLHQGRDETAIDCVGLIVYAVGYDVGKVPAYPRDPINNELETNLTIILGPPLLDKPRSIDVLREGDIAALQYKGPIRHVALVANHPTIKGALSLIHTDSMVGKVTEHILDAKWLRRIEKVWRI